jgi:hypothetical protein
VRRFPGCRHASCSATSFGGDDPCLGLRVGLWQLPRPAPRRVLDEPGHLIAAARAAFVGSGGGGWGHIYVVGETAASRVISMGSEPCRSRRQYARMPILEIAGIQPCSPGGYMSQRMIVDGSVHRFNRPQTSRLPLG